MSDPALTVQGAVYTALTGASVCSGRIYDRVPEDPTFPYVSIGDDESIDDGTTCFDASEVIVTVNVWSRAVGYPEVKGIASTIRTTLATELSVSPHRCVYGEHLTTNFLPDPDGITRRARMQFRYLIDHEL